MQKLTYKTIATPLKVEIPKIKGSRFFATLFPILLNFRDQAMIENQQILLESQSYQS